MIIPMITDIRTIAGTIMGVTSTAHMIRANFALLESRRVVAREGGRPGNLKRRIILGSPLSRGMTTRSTAGDWTIFASVLAALLAAAVPVVGQTSDETLRAEGAYRECLYSKSRSGRYTYKDRESDFGLLGECRNQWVAYMDVCNKAGFDNPTCVMKSRLVIHAILNLTGK
jgi:hypothetical protein